jgi:arginyl-tRNA synthetase
MDGKFRDEVVKQIASATRLDKERIEKLLETPPDQKLGDLAFPCFSLAKELRKDPKTIASDISKKAKEGGLIREVMQAGPYVNFFADWGKVGQKSIEAILKDRKYGAANPTKKVVLVEFPGPNTNKPLHLGHMRNMALGESVSRIISNAGHDVKRVNINNDRGVHICKSMLAYQKWGKGQTPEKMKKKSDHFVGDFYVMYEKKKDDSLENEVKELLLKWEAGDKETIELWKRMNKWAFDGFKETYSKFGVNHDKEYYESDTYQGGKELVMKGLGNGTFYRDDTGAVMFNLDKYGLGQKVLLRSDGTAVYMTQDIFTAKKRHEDFGFDMMVYVVANEQDYHFQVLFQVLDILGFKFSKDCYHLSYGMVNLPSGRMKSREGTVVDADDLIAEMETLARKEITSRDRGIGKKELEKRASQIAMGAIKYYLLKNDAVKSMMFNPEESISFEGNTGPYIQYSHARIASIFRKAGKVPAKFDISLLKEEKERALMKLLLEFPKAAEDAARDYRPHYITTFAYGLAAAFNDFYESCRVLQAETLTLKAARLALCKATQLVLEKALGLLGIEAPEKM